MGRGEANGVAIYVDRTGDEHQHVQLLLHKQHHLQRSWSRTNRRNALQISKDSSVKKGAFARGVDWRESDDDEVTTATATPVRASTPAAAPFFSCARRLDPSFELSSSHWPACLSQALSGPTRSARCGLRRPAGRTRTRAAWPVAVAPATLLPRPSAGALL